MSIDDVHQAIAERREARRKGQEVLMVALRDLKGQERREGFQACLGANIDGQEIARLAGISKQRVHKIVNG